MAEIKDIYKLGQSKTGTIQGIGEEIRIDLDLEDNIITNSGTVFGKVLDTDGKAIEGVTIKITDVDYNPKYHDVTNNAGEYTIADIEAGKQYFIFAAKDGYELKQGIPFAMQTAQQIERGFVLTIDTEGAHSLVAGDVLDINNQPLEGVTVILYKDDIILKTTYTNQYGQYAFFDVPQGVYKIEASLLGYKTTSTTFIIDGPRQVRNIILNMNEDPVSRKGTINGIIKDKNNNPVENAYVILFQVITDSQGKETLKPIKTTWTNDEGLYLFEQIPQGNYKIKANKSK